MADIRDFILDQEVLKDKEPEKERAKTQVIYETVLVSGPDFVVRRKTSKTSSLLVMMLSLDQMYIKNEKTGAIDKLTEKNLSSFLSGANQEPVVNEEGMHPFWLKYLDHAKNFKDAMRIVLNSASYREFLCSGYAFLSTYSGRSEKKIEEIKKAIGENMLKKIFNNFSEGEKDAFRGSISSYNYVSNHDFAFTAPVSKKIDGFLRLFDCSRSYNRYNNYDLKSMNKDNVRYMVERYFVSPAITMPSTDAVLTRGKINGEKRSLNERKIIDHCFDSGIEQGYAESLGEFCACWGDYLHQQELVYGKLVDKYPKNLASDETRLSYIYRQKKELIDAENFEHAADKMREYRYEGKDYIITSPEAPVDMIEESKNMSNCLSSYVNRVINEGLMIFFLREKSKPDVSFVDIEIRSDGSLGQVLSRFNHSAPPAARSFVHEWYDKKFAA